MHSSQQTHRCYMQGGSIMKQLRSVILFCAILGLALAGCGDHNDPVLPDPPTGDHGSTLSTPLAPNDTPSPALSTADIILNGYLVQFDGRTVADDQTTFSYTVTGAGAEHALSHFFLEIPGCAPPLDSYTPPGATIGIEPHVGIYGIKWNLSLDTDGSRSYSITFPGDVPPGIIRTSVKASTLAALGTIPGPCAGFVISGTVFVDADANGILDAPDESGIGDVTVTLSNGVGDIQAMATDANGYYVFVGNTGTYTIRIDGETAADDFNETLAASFDPTGPTSLVVTVGPDSHGNDFGFDPRTDEITYDIEQGALLTTGEPVKFWKKQLRAAISDSRGKVEFDAATMTQFITGIQGLFLPDPFQFTPGSEFQEAMDILSTNSKEPLDILLKELLAAEFNEVSGKGLVEVSALQSVLLAWAESVVVAASTTPPLTSPNSGRVLLGGPIDGRVVDAINLLVKLNGTTGGGSGGGG